MTTGVGIISEATTGVEHGKVVKDLNVTLAQLDLNGVLLGKEVDGVEGLGLDLRHGRDRRMVRREVRPGKGAP